MRQLHSRRLLQGPGRPAGWCCRTCRQERGSVLKDSRCAGPRSTCPGVHRLTVRAVGYQTYDRQVIITPGETYNVRLDMQTSEEDAGPCDRFGPAYNQDNLCFDTRPVPLSPTLIPVAQDAPVFPRQAILLVRVSRNGTTQEARVFVPSNVETFNNEALDMARNLRWNPAQKNGEPTEAWVQWPFQPVRQ